MAHGEAEDRLNKLVTEYAKYYSWPTRIIRGWMHDSPQCYLLALALFSITFCGCLTAPPGHALSHSVPLAPLAAIVVFSRILFGIYAARISAVLTAMVVGWLSYDQLSDPGISVWVAGYFAALIGISIRDRRLRR